MLTEDQINDVWEGQISAEVRALYFGDLASLYGTRKQWITAVSFCSSSGAAATLIARMPVWLPIVCSTTVAVITAYAVAVNLDSHWQHAPGMAFFVAAGILLVSLVVAESVRPTAVADKAQLL